VIQRERLIHRPVLKAHAGQLREPEGASDEGGLFVF